MLDVSYILILDSLSLEGDDTQHTANRVRVIFHNPKWCLLSILGSDLSSIMTLETI